MNTADAKRVLETALICSQQPLQLRDLRVLFDDAEVMRECALRNGGLNWTHALERFYKYII